MGTQPGLSSKYRIIMEAQYPPKDDKEREQRSHDYATFMKNLERTCGPDGFVDSQHFQYKYRMKQEHRQQPEASSSAPMFKQSTGASSKDAPPKKNIIVVAKENERYLEQHNDRIKHIQYNMVTAKQSERSLKRMEGSVLKSQQELRKSMRQFEKDVADKRLDEEKKFNEAISKYDVYQRDYDRDMVEDAKARMRRVRTTEQYEKSQERKSHLNTLQLDCDYRHKLDELEQKRNERARLAWEYETKLRQKEEEENRLNREIQEVLHAMQIQNIKQKQYEGQKQQKHRETKHSNVAHDRQKEIELEQKLGQSGNELRKADSVDKQLSAKLRTKQDVTNVQKRDLQRGIESTRLRLSQTTEQQKKLSEDTAEVERDKKRHDLENKLKAVEARRVDNFAAKSHDRQKAKEASEAMLQQRAHNRHLEEERLSHEDSLRHFERILRQGESLDHSMFVRLKQAEQAEQLQEQQVRQMSDKLHRLEQENAEKVNESVRSANNKEQRVREKLSAARAELLSKRAEKEFLLTRLRLHRSLLEEDRHLVQEHRKQKSHLDRIAMAADNKKATEHGHSSNQRHHATHQQPSPSASSQLPELTSY